MNIVVAEDDAVTAHLITRTLEKSAHSVSTARTGKEALELLKRKACDALVTDWMMPEMDGIELIRRVRAELPSAPAIVMCTSLGDAQAREYALRSGADGFIAKPIVARELLDLLTSLAAKRGQQYAQISLLPQPTAPVRIVAPVAPSHASTLAIAIAASTGGPEAVRALFTSGPPSQGVAYFVALHGPDWMQHSCVKGLQTEVPKLSFAVAQDGMAVEPGHVYFAPGDRHLLVSATGLTLKLSDDPPENFVRPAADPLFRSVAYAFGVDSVGIVLTGLGCDGAKGAREIAGARGQIYVQEPSGAVARWMPEAAIRAVERAEVLPLTAFGPALSAWAERRRSASANVPLVAGKSA